MIRASDIVFSKLTSVSVNDSLLDVLKLFLDEKTDSVVVIGQGEKVLGLLTAQAALKAFVMSKSSQTASDSLSEFKSVLAKIAFAGAEDSLMILVRKLVASECDRLIIRNKDEKMVGVVTPHDILYAVLSKEL